MDVLVFTFARLEDGLDRVERQAAELEARERSGTHLANEERDWLDWANGVMFVANNSPVAA